MIKSHHVKYVCVCVLCWSQSSIAFHILKGVSVSRENLRLNPIWEVLLYVTVSMHIKAQRPSTTKKSLKAVCYFKSPVFLPVFMKNPDIVAD